MTQAATPIYGILNRRYPARMPPEAAISHKLAQLKALTDVTPIHWALDNIEKNADACSLSDSEIDLLQTIINTLSAAINGGGGETCLLEARDRAVGLLDSGKLDKPGGE